MVTDHLLTDHLTFLRRVAPVTASVALKFPSATQASVALKMKTFFE